MEILAEKQKLRVAAVRVAKLSNSIELHPGWRSRAAFQSVWSSVSPGTSSQGYWPHPASRQQRRHWLEQGWIKEAGASYSMSSPNAALTGGWEA